MGNEVARRGFIKGVALAGIGVAGTGILAGCGLGSSKSTSIPTKWDKEADIVVVGGGGTGIVAAIGARESNNSVIVLEKAATVGGNTAISSGVIQAAGTKYQKEFSDYKDDTPQKHYEYWIRAAEGIADPDIVKELANDAPNCIDWLVAHGLSYIDVYGVARIPYIDAQYMADRIHVPGGGTNGVSGWGKFHVDTLYKSAQSLGAEFMLNTPVKKLIRNGDQGVIGVVADQGGKDITIKAKKAVIMGSGGYDRNKVMAKTYCPHQLWALEQGVCFAAPTNTGDGHLMGQAIGADLAGMGGNIGLPTSNVGITPTLPNVPAVPGIYVNKYGERFVAESDHYGYVMRIVFAQEEHIAWSIFDESVKKLGGKLVSGISSMSEDLTKEIADGKVIMAPTIKELADKINVNADNLVKTMDTWNKDMTTTKKDSQFNKTVGLTPLNQAPYYAIKIIEYNLGTVGGLRINTKGQVLDTEANVIPRLYAGGQCSGGFMGPYYPGTGSGIISTVYFGRLCSKIASGEKAWS